MELGSEFSLHAGGDVCEDNIFRYFSGYQTVYTDSGRSAARLLDTILPRGAILLPAYICDSVCGCYPNREKRFYAVTDDAQPDWDDLSGRLTPDTAVVYLHYFNGVLPDPWQWERLRRAKATLGFTIVEDTTHSVFSAPLTAGDYAVCSLRKWFPVPDGGVLYAPSGSPLPRSPQPDAAWAAEKAEAMSMKARYLRGEGGERLNAAYREAFARCDDALNRQRDICALSALSRDLLLTCSVSRMKKRRQENFALLRERLSALAFLTPFAQTEGSECPLTFPVETERRDALRAFLIARRVYCAVHWPLDGAPAENPRARRIAARELSLPIDQRYGPEEISYLVEQLIRFGSENGLC